MARGQNLLGKKFGRLTVVKQVEKPESRKKKGRYWLCECDCGSGKEVIVSTMDLNSGHTTSCGCILKEKAAKRLAEQNRRLAGTGKKNKMTQFYIEKDYAYGYTSNTDQKFYIDLDDLEFAEKYTWHANDNGYIMSRINGTLVRLHRVIMSCPDDMEVDHKNHNTYDNRKSNLRIVTRSQNNMNRDSKGVHFVEKDNRYVAYIKINGERKHLGSFANENDAIKARKDAEDRYFGEYSYSNSVGDIS